MKKIGLLLILLCVFFSSCALNPFGSKGSGDQYSGPRGTKPYTIKGQTYYPLLSADGYSEEGTASWYGPDFHGKKTANGEKYNQHDLTAAHKILPFGTQVKVTNLRNGKSVEVRINDRGPFVSGRVIDLSNKAAKKIDMVSTGTAPVRVQTLGNFKGKQKDDIQGRFYVQIGAFSVKQNAQNLVNAFRKSGWQIRMVSEGLHFVQVGPFNSLKKAYDVVPLLIPSYPDLVVVADK